MHLRGVLMRGQQSVTQLDSTVHTILIFLETISLLILNSYMWSFQYSHSPVTKDSLQLHGAAP